MFFWQFQYLRTLIKLTKNLLFRWHLLNDQNIAAVSLFHFCVQVFFFLWKGMWCCLHPMQLYCGLFSSISGMTSFVASIASRLSIICLKWSSFWTFTMRCWIVGAKIHDDCSISSREARRRICESSFVIIKFSWFPIEFHLRARWQRRRCLVSRKMMKSQRTRPVKFKILQHLNHTVTAGESDEWLTMFCLTLRFPHFVLDCFKVVLDCKPCRGTNCIDYFQVYVKKR